MTWVEHSLVGTGIFYIARGFGKKLSLSVLLIASTVMMDIDHLWFRIGCETILKANGSLALGFWLDSDTWTHSLIYLMVVSLGATCLFEQRKMIFISCFLGGFLHLVGDWLYRWWMFDMGLLWLWPFSWELF